MTVTLRLLVILSAVCRTENRCSSSPSYKSCWIRRFPGTFVDIKESERRGAQLLKFSQEESAVKCSRTCCLTRNFSCNLAVFHYKPVLQSVNCVHLHCPTLESCVLRRKHNPALYHVTHGGDSDLLLFGKYFSPSARMWPHLSSPAPSMSEPLVSDTPQLSHPLVPPTPPGMGPSEPHPSWNPTSSADPPGAGGSGTTLPSSTRTITEPSGTTLHSSSPLPIHTAPTRPDSTTACISSSVSTGVGEGGWDSPRTSAWLLVAKALLAPLLGCSAALLGCGCCLALMAVGLRARRKGISREL